MADEKNSKPEIQNTWVGDENDSLKKNYSEIAPRYDQTRYLGQKAQFTSKTEGEALRWIVSRYTDERGILLDIACGTGNFTHQLSDLFTKLVGIDLTQGMLQYAVSKKKTPDQKLYFVQASALDLPVKEEICDVVITTRFLHLWPQKEHKQLLEIMLKALKSGGILIVEHDSNFVNWLYRLILGPFTGKWKEGSNVYCPSEQPDGARRLARIGISAPGLPTLSLLWPGAARLLSKCFKYAPLNRLSSFVCIIYQKL